MLYFVYEETFPDTGIPFYVGISNNPNQRHKQHIDARDNNLRKRAVIEQLTARSLEPKINILESVHGERNARIREKYWIQCYIDQGIILTNIQDHDLSVYTEFGECLFRSFREAQWAVFFKTLNIPYQYRKKGIVIGDEWYIPSFWLPQQDCFIEILEQLDTSSGLHMLKEREMALQTGKPFYGLYGDISLSSDHLQIYAEFPPEVWSIDYLTRRAVAKIEVSQEALVLMQRLYDMGLGLSALGSRHLYIVPHAHQSFSIGEIGKYLKIAQKQIDNLPALIHSIRYLENELAATLWIQGEYPELQPWEGSGYAGFCWSECAKCEHIIPKYLSQEWTHGCKNCTDGVAIFESPRLIAAITLARQFGNNQRE